MGNDQGIDAGNGPTVVDRQEQSDGIESDGIELMDTDDQQSVDGASDTLLKKDGADPVSDVVNPVNLPEDVEMIPDPEMTLKDIAAPSTVDLVKKIDNANILSEGSICHKNKNEIQKNGIQGCVENGITKTMIEENDSRKEDLEKEDVDCKENNMQHAEKSTKAANGSSNIDMDDSSKSDEILFIDDEDDLKQKN